ARRGAADSTRGGGRQPAEPPHPDSGSPARWSGVVRDPLRALSRRRRQGQRTRRLSGDSVAAGPDDCAAGRACRRLSRRHHPQRQHRDARLWRHHVGGRALGGGAVSAPSAGKGGHGMTRSSERIAAGGFAILAIAGGAVFSIAVTRGMALRAWEAFLVNLLFW